MNTRELENIVTLADEGSITRAAEKLYMAQSSLSQFLQQYEKRLGTTLFIRTSTGIKTTSCGEIFINHAREILQKYRQAENELWDMANLQGGRIVLGISSFRGRYLLPPVLKAFYEKYPKVQVEIVEENSMALEELILNGTLDMAVVVLPLVKLNQEVDFLKKDEVFIVSNKKHPIMKYAKKKDLSDYYWIDLKDASEFEFILSDYSTILGNISRREFKKLGLNLISHNTNITAAMAAAMAREGLGLAFTYRSCVEKYEDIEYLTIGKEGVFLDLAIAYPPSGYRSNASIVLGKMLQDYHE
jgi:DNA-binding transcriptional LysR family regulator